jgi:hypothetical protein
MVALCSPPPEEGLLIWFFLSGTESRAESPDTLKQATKGKSLKMKWHELSKHSSTGYLK